MTHLRYPAALIVSFFLAATAHGGGPYPAISGISAAADDAAVAGMNPAGMTRFDSTQRRFEILGFFSDNTWEGQIGESGPSFRSDNNSTTIVPSGSMVIPFRDDWWFGFTFVGAGVADEYEDGWPGRYFIEEYSLIYISAFPSIATKVTDNLSVAGSLAITYTTFEQDKAVLNLDPGFDDGSLKIDTDGFEVGFGLSGLYEFSDRTRVGLTYRSEIDTELDGNLKFSNLSPTTEEIFEMAGLLDAPVTVTSRSPQVITAGIYHELDNGSAFTFDFAWADFSNFKLSEIYIDGDQLTESVPIYGDIYAVSSSYSWPVRDDLRLGVGAFFVDDMVKDDDRTLTLRLDSMWSLGFGVKWQWKEERAVTATLNYLKIGEAPVTTSTIGPIGPVTGRFTDRKTIFLQVALSLGSGA